MSTLIGISGRLGAGKDTVGAAILYEFAMLNSPENKPMFGEIYQDLKEHMWWLTQNSGWEIKKFAGKLKEISSMLTGIPTWKFEDQDFKKTDLPEEWDEVKFGNKFPMTVRQFLQKVGTEGMRDNVHKNIWINGLFSDFKSDSNWVVTDCRFKNEFDAIKKRNGLIIYIERGENKIGGNHSSETEMEVFKDKCDYHIDNNGSLESLREQIKHFLTIHDLLNSHSKNDVAVY